MPSFYIVKNGVEVEVSEAEFNAPQPASSDSGSKTAATTTQGDAPRDQSNVAEQKTTTSSGGNLMDSEDKYTPSAENNILNRYRSWNYNFSIGAIDLSIQKEGSVIDSTLVAASIKKFNVLNSAGKGNAGMGIAGSVAKSTSIDQGDVKGLVGSFNKNSAGRFDMYIDNVEIDSLIGAGSEEAGSSQATRITFDVYEPYSMNGFVEALQVAAQAAGYSDYMKAIYAIQFQFQGYPDNQAVASSRSEVIPKSTRYFIITITGLEVDVNEQGTRYKVKAVPTAQMGFGISNKLISDIQVAGNTVGEVLTNFFKAINDMVKGASDQERGNTNSDTYSISCPKLATPGSPQNVQSALLYPGSGSSNASQNDMVKAKMNDELKSTNVFKPADPAQFKNGYVGAKNYVASTAEKPTTTTEDPATGKAIPNKGTVAFASNQQIHDCIAAIVRDSEWVREKVLSNEALDAAKQGLNNGMLPYFTVRMETSLGEYDTVGNKYFYNYRYILEPYMIHYTRVPGQEQGTVDVSKIKGQIKRSYNYIYTGKNVDVLKFNLHFNTLYFTAIPANLGNRPASSATGDAAAPDNTQDTTQQASKAANAKPAGGDSVGTVANQRDPGQNQRPATRAGQQQEDPYYKMAETMHNAVLNGTDLIKGTLEILGDPYFLVTGGMATQNLTLSDPFITPTGEAAVTQGELFININFRNPIDIKTTGPQAGMMNFNSKLVSFSGVYRLLKLKSHFKDGRFTQGLEIIRIPGQILGKETATPANNIKTAALAGEQKVKDTASSLVTKFGTAVNSFNLNTLLSEAKAGIDTLTSKIRLSASGLSSLPGVTEIQNAAAAVTAAGATFGTLTGDTTAVTNLATEVTNAATNAGQTVDTAIATAGTAAIDQSVVATQQQYGV